jgi:hypothetical protein
MKNKIELLGTYGSDIYPSYLFNQALKENKYD